jgi:hypothetical protein
MIDYTRTDRWIDGRQMLRNHQQSRFSNHSHEAQLLIRIGFNMILIVERAGDVKSV